VNRTRSGIESASKSALIQQEKDRGGREMLRQRSPTELLAFCTASCVVCSREFIVLYLDRRYLCRRGFVDAGLSTCGDGEKIIVRFSWLGKSSRRHCRHRVAECAALYEFRKTMSLEMKIGDIITASPASIIDR